MKRNKKGFTLAELLIVVAIIAVLTAIAIPVFNTATEKAALSADAANIRAAYAEIQVASIDSSIASATSVKFTAQSSGKASAGAMELKSGSMSVALPAKANNNISLSKNTEFEVTIVDGKINVAP